MGGVLWGVVYLVLWPFFVCGGTGVFLLLFLFELYMWESGYIYSQAAIFNGPFGAIFFFGILLLLYLILDCFDTVGIDFYCLETGVIGNLSFLVDTCVSIPIGISWRVMYPLPIGPSVSGPNPSEEI